MQTSVHPLRANGRSTERLLQSGMLAGPLYVIAGLAQVLTREGFDVGRHALSQLSNGEFGWVQIANFLVCGALVIAGAIGARRVLHPGRGGTWGPILLGVYGLGLIGAGIFPADPGRGFPPGTAAGPAEMTRAGLLHFVFGGIGFYALIAGCLVFARRFAASGRPEWAAYSLFTGIGFFLAFGAIASGSTAPTPMLAFYAAVVWIWAWHAALHQMLLAEARAASS